MSQPMVPLSTSSKLRPEGSMWLPQSLSDTPNAFASAPLSMSTTTGNSRYNCAKTSAAIWLNSLMFGGVSAIVAKLYKRTGWIIEDVQPLDDCSPLVATYPVGRRHDDIAEIVAINEIELASRRVDDEPAPEINWLELLSNRVCDTDAPRLPVLIDIYGSRGRQASAKPNHAHGVRLLHSEATKVSTLLGDSANPLCVSCGALYFDGLPAGSELNVSRANRRPFEGVVVQEAEFGSQPPAGENLLHPRF